MVKQKKKFNIDLLEVTFKSRSERNVEQIMEIPEMGILNRGRFSLCRKEPNNYKYNFEVRDCQGRIVGAFFFGTYNPTRPYFYLKVANRMLYEDIYIVHDFERDLGLSFYRISKLDICMDTDSNLVYKFYRLIGDKNQQIILNNKSIKDRDLVIKQIKHMSTGSLNNTRKVKTFYVEGNEYELKGYDKANEIDSSSRKEYIREQTGLTKKMYRMEVHFKNYKILKENLDRLNYDTQDIYNALDSQELLAEIFYSSTNRIIHIKGGKSIIDYLLNPLPRTNKKDISAPYLLMGGEKTKKIDEEYNCGTVFAQRPDSFNEKLTVRSNTIGDITMYFNPFCKETTKCA